MSITRSVFICAATNAGIIHIKRRSLLKKELWLHLVLAKHSGFVKPQRQERHLCLMSAGALLGLVLAAELSTRNGREFPRNHLFPQRRYRINEHHSLEVGELMLHYPGQETVGPLFVLGEIFIHITHFHTFWARNLLVDTGNAQAALFQ